MNFLNFLPKDAVRELRRQLREDNRQHQPWQFREVPQYLWPRNAPIQPTRVMRSREYLVQIFQFEKPGITRLSVCRTDCDAHGKWLDGISWDDLQRIKNCIGYAERDAIEIYPRETDIVNAANMRHLWVYDETNAPMDFIWRNSAQSGST